MSENNNTLFADFSLEGEDFQDLANIGSANGDGGTNGNDGAGNPTEGKTTQDDGTQSSGKGATLENEMLDFLQEGTGDNAGSPAPASNGEQDIVVSPYAPLASALHEQGFLPNFSQEEFEKAEDKQAALFEAINAEIRYGVDSYKSTLPPQLREELEAFEQGVPLEEFRERTKPFDLGKITEESIRGDKEVAKKVTIQNLVAGGMDITKATKVVETMAQSDEFEKEAVDSYKELKGKETATKAELAAKARLANEQAELNKANTLKNIKEAIDKTEVIVPGIKLNPNVKDSVYKSMTSIVGYDPNGKPLNAVMAARAEDPVKFEMTLHYLNQLGVFKGKWDKIISSQKTKAVQQLEEALSRSGSYTAGKGNVTAANKDDGGSVLDFIN